jgi:hypothetical protein
MASQFITRSRLRRLRNRTRTVHVEILGFCYGDYYHSVRDPHAPNDLHVIFRHPSGGRIHYQKLSQAAVSSPLFLEIRSRFDRGDRYLAIRAKGRDWIGIESQNSDSETPVQQNRGSVWRLIASMRSHCKHDAHRLRCGVHSDQQAPADSAPPVPTAKASNCTRNSSGQATRQGGEGR